MRKSTLIVTIFTLLTLTAMGQVGIGTVQPADGTLLDIDPEMGDKGILIPRVQIDDLNTTAPITLEATSTLQVGTMVFNNAGANPLGFYYWDGTKWVRLTGNDTDETLYSRDGTLSENRRVSTGDNSLTIFNNLSTGKSNGRDALVLQRGSNDKEVGIAFQNSGGFYDSSISQGIGVQSDLIFATGGNQQLKEDVLTTMTLRDNGQLTLPRYTGTNFDANPASFLGIDATGNVVKSAASFMPINKTNFLGNGVFIEANNVNNGNTVQATSTGILDNEQITLSQRSLVHYTYQFSVVVEGFGGATVSDGAPRLFRSWFTVNNNNTSPLGFDTGTYASRPTTSSTGTVYANGFYYLSGSGYVELPAGSHSFRLFILGYSGDATGFRLKLGETDFESIQAVIHR